MAKDSRNTPKRAEAHNRQQRAQGRLQLALLSRDSSLSRKGPWAAFQAATRWPQTRHMSHRLPQQKLSNPNTHTHHRRHRAEAQEPKHTHTHTHTHWHRKSARTKTGIRSTGAAQASQTRVLELERASGAQKALNALRQQKHTKESRGGSQQTAGAHGQTAEAHSRQTAEARNPSACHARRTR